MFLRPGSGGQMDTGDREEKKKSHLASHFFLPRSDNRMELNVVNVCLAKINPKRHASDFDRFTVLSNPRVKNFISFCEGNGNYK